MLGAEARTVVNGDPCRGSCVERARTVRAALSDHHAHRPATLAPSAGRAVQCQWCWRRVPMSARAPRASLGATSDSRSGTSLRPRSQLARSSRPAGSSAPATRRLPGCTQCIGTAEYQCTRCTNALGVVDPRVPCAPAEREGLPDRYGHGSGTANGPIGRRSPGQPVAVTSPTWLRGTQQASIGAELRAARARPVGDPPGTLWVRPGALPSSHGPSLAKVAHEPGRRCGWHSVMGFPCGKNLTLFTASLLGVKTVLTSGAGAEREW